MAENKKNKKRKIDKVAASVSSWKKKDVIFIKKSRVKSWKIIFAVAFLVGAASALLWLIHLRMESKSKAAMRKKSPLMAVMKTGGCVADGLLTGSGGDTAGLIDMINRSECKYLHRSIETWLIPPDFNKIAQNMAKIKKKDMIFGMFLAEAINPNAIYYYPDGKRNFNFSAMCKNNSVGFWGDGTCKASFASNEYRLYLRYITRKAIDMGVQTFLIGQIYFQDSGNLSKSKATEIVGEMRAYADSKGKPIVIGAQTNDIADPDYLQLFDYIEGGVGVHKDGSIEDGPCFSKWWKKPGDRCWALLWHKNFSSKANDVLLNFDWSGFRDDDMSIFAQMNRKTRAATLQNLYSTLTTGNTGFMLPFLAVINDSINGCYGPQKNYYTASDKYSCRDENIMNSILREGSKKAAAADVTPVPSIMAATAPTVTTPVVSKTIPEETASQPKEKEEASENITAPSIENDAQFVSQIVPTEMTAGYRYQISITIKNTGDTVWKRDQNYYLDLKTSRNNFLIKKAELSSSDSVAPEQTKTFTFDFSAPSAPGEYDFQWSMSRGEGKSFGNLTEIVKIKVIK